MSLELFERAADVFESTLRDVMRIESFDEPSTFERMSEFTRGLRADATLASNAISSRATRVTIDDSSETDVMIALDGGRARYGFLPCYEESWERLAHGGSDAIDTYERLRRESAIDGRREKPTRSSSNNFTMYADRLRRTFRVLVHKRTPYTSTGLIGDGRKVPRHWILSSTRHGIACIPSLGYLRAFDDRYAFDCRVLSTLVPFYAYPDDKFSKPRH